MLIANKKYNIIVADPPWKFGQKQTKTSLRVEQHYHTMSLKELYAFDIIKILLQIIVLFICGHQIVF